MDFSYFEVLAFAPQSRIGKESVFKAMQLDIFEHSRDVMLRNDVIVALRRRDAGGVTDAIARLTAEFGRDPLLPAFAILCEALCRPVPKALDREAAIDALRMIETAVVPAARQVFGASADACLAPLWGDLAAAVSALTFDSNAESAHAAPLLLRLGKWAEAVACVDAIPSWRRQPAPLSWKTEALCHSAGFVVAWPLFAELAWIAPARAMALTQQLATPELSHWLRRFHTEFEGEGQPSDLAWFPAWAAIVAPPLAAGLPLTQPGSDTPPERCARLIVGLLTLERQGRHAELVAGREKLRDRHPALFALYMQTR